MPRLAQLKCLGSRNIMDADHPDFKKFIQASPKSKSYAQLYSQPCWEFDVDGQEEECMSFKCVTFAKSSFWSSLSFDGCTVSQAASSNHLEHSPHRREARKFLPSKHHQIRLWRSQPSSPPLVPAGAHPSLKTASSGHYYLSAILPTNSGGDTALPEDRFLWPSYLSGGLLPIPTPNIHPRITTESYALLSGHRNGRRQ
ncbi:hypothetical protein M422DRAFT_246868 [Sphaerobolus stellatus SS14]|nr:hypothetical protein M422DRAFT_246868 [Sphaerobolus stellatus SS14]